MFVVINRMIRSLWHRFRQVAAIWKARKPRPGSLWRRSSIEHWMLDIVAVVSCCCNFPFCTSLKVIFASFFFYIWWLSISGSIGTVFRLPYRAAMDWRAQHSTPGLLAKSGSGPKPTLATRTGTGKGGFGCCLYFRINRNELAPTSLE